MASLNTLEVRGLSRFLNTIYANDLTVNGTFGTSGDVSVGGNLSVTGNSTLKAINGTSLNINSGTITAGAIELLKETPYIDFHFNNSTADYTSRIVEETSGTITIKPNLKVGTSATIPTANITTATVSTGNFTNVNVSNVLRAARYDLQTVGQLGGAFYVSPTVKFPNSNTSVTITKSGTTLTIAITDGSITSTTMAGIVWASGIKVKASGKFSNIASGTMDGTVTSINTSSHQLNITVSGENSGNVAAGTYTSSNLSDFYVMAYNMGGSTNYPVGIILNSYGTDGRTYIDIYGGTTAETAPNVRIGNLGGLIFNDNTLSNQWGIYTNNGYFSGMVNANGGRIGGFTIGETAIYTGTITENADNNIGLSTADFTRTVAGSSKTNLRMAFGNKFGLTGTGILYTSDIQANGGNIAGWMISGEALGKASADTTTEGELQYQAYLYAPSSVTSTTNAIMVRQRKYTNGAYWGWTYPFRVTYGGKLYATDAEISGKITATSGSISGSLVTSGINADNITAGTISIERLTALEVGGRNLLKDSENLGSSWVKDNCTASEGIVTLDSSKTGNIRLYQMPANGYWTWKANQNYTVSIDAKASSNNLLFYFNAVGLSKQSDDIPLTTEWKRYTWTVTSTRAIDGSMSFFAKSGQSGTIQFRKPQLELGTKATDWTPAPEDTIQQMQDNLDNLEVGGRNLLKTTEAVYTPARYAIYDIYLTEPIESGQQYILQLWDVDVSHTGKTDSTLGINVYYCGGSVTFGGWEGTDYFTNGHADYLKLIFTAYTSGATVTSGGNILPSPANNALAHSSITGATSNFIRIYNSAPSVDGTKNAKIGRWKLEKGDKATDWSPAPEDVYTEIQGTNLSPFFSHTLTDIYNATTNPNGYWVKNGSNGWTDKSQFTFTRLEDGWLHVHIDNSSGTGIIRNDCCCPRYNPAIKPNTKYTFLIELRNNTSTGVDSGSNIYMVQQGGGVQFWGTNTSESVGVKIGGVGGANAVGLTDIPTDSNYTFNRSTKMSLDITSTYYGTNMMMTYVFRANAGAVLDYDIRISMYEGIYYGPYVPYKANNANYLYYDSTNGLIISENATGQTYNSASSGYNTQLKNDGLYIRNNSDVLAKYGENITLKSSDDVNYLLIEKTGLDIYNKHNVSIFKVVSNYDFPASADYVYQTYSDKNISDLNGKSLSGTISFSYYINTASLKYIQYKYENESDFSELDSSLYTSNITLSNGEINYTVTFNSNAFTGGEETISDEDIDTTTTSNIVDLKIAFDRTVNSGYYNIGARKNNSDIGLYSLIIGENNSATRAYSVSIGYNSSARGWCSYGLGQNVDALNTYTFGVGYNTKATGYISSSMGSYNTASGSHSFARGYNNVASGEYSFASGRYLNATTKDLTAIGRFNTTASYLKSDLLFVIGNGSSTSSRSNSTEIYKNGMIRMMGTYPSLHITPTKPNTSPQDALDRGGVVVLNPSTNSPQYAGVVMEQYQNSVRFYSLPSVDGTSYTGYGKEIKFDLRAGTITGNHKLNTTGYDSTSITKGSNITVKTGNIIKKNGIVQVYYEFTTTAAISAWGTVGTIPSGYRPLTNTPRVLGEEGGASTGKFFQINTGGSIFNVNALTANTTYVVWFTYIANI